MDIRQVAAAYGAKSLESVAKADKKTAPKMAMAVPTEQVEISDASLSMQKMKAIINEIPDVRIKVVDEIRTKIKFNGYPLESNIYKAIQNMVSDNIL